ncbi:MAG: hypothetical protein WCV50_06885 [Patescibacteria group bacterium]|jgi:hypothetical protein
MRKIVPIIIVVILLLAGAFFWREQIERQEKYSADAIANPPQFSVHYSFYFPSLMSISQTTDHGNPTSEINKDMRGIKDMGFEGVKMSFTFKNDNTLVVSAAGIAVNKGLKPIGLLAGHTAKPKNRAFDNEEIELWKSFVRTTVSDTKNNIYYWEIWNEPTMVELFRYGTPQEFVDLLKITTPIIRAENPQAKIIVTLDEGDREAADFTNQALELGAGDYFDILSFHPYASVPYIIPEVFLQKVAMQKTLAEKYGNRWPLWITEIGQPVSQVGEEEQANLAKLVFETARKEKIPVTWLGYTDQQLPAGTKIGDGTGWGIIDENGRPRKCYEAIKNILKSP